MRGDRFGTCGGVRAELVPGSVVVAGKGSVSVTRNPDAFFPDAPASEACYRVSRVMPASQQLSTAVRATGPPTGGSLLLTGC